jgi:hypothetical protein
VAPRPDRRWPRYVLDRARQAPAPGSGVVPGSTPVVCLGNPAAAAVATLGIAPPARQFLDHSGRLLTGARRRLATLDSLDAPGAEGLTTAHARSVVDACAGYFERHPYHWFEPLDEVLRTGLGASYYAGTACHLHLVQSATSTRWTGLTPAMQSDLLRADIGFVRRQLDEGSFRVVVVTGRPALRWVQESGLVTWRRSATLHGTPPAGVYTGLRGNLRFVGWSCTLQGSAGAAAQVPRVAELVAELAGADDSTLAATAG